MALHYYLKYTDYASDPLVRYVPLNFVDMDNRPGDWRQLANENRLLDLGKLSSNMSSNLAREIRDNFKNFFVSEAGKIPWQEEVVLRGAEPDHR